MSLKLITLNIERDRHTNDVLNFLKSEKADVICLQEFPKKHLEMFKKELGLKAEYVHLELESEFCIEHGSVMLTNLEKLNSQSYSYYKENDHITRKGNKVNLDFSVLFSEIKKDEKTYNIATLHYPVTKGGKIEQKQIDAYFSLHGFTQNFEDLILCGDFNSPRGGEMFDIFTKEFKDNVPKDIDTTLDPSRHRNSEIRYVVDNIFSKGKYKVSNVRVIDNVSDHKALVGNISSN